MKPEHEKTSEINISITSNSKRSTHRKGQVFLGSGLGILLAIGCLMGITRWKLSSDAPAKQETPPKVLSESRPDNREEAVKLANQALNEVKLANFTSAQKFSQDAFELNDNLPLALSIRGFCKSLLGNKKEDYEAARLDLEKAVKIEPENALFQMWLVDVYSKLEKTDKAKETANNVLTQLSSPLSDIDYYARAKANSYLDKYEEAVKDYSKAIEINSRFVVAYNNRGSIYESRKQFDPAIDDFNKAIEINPRFAYPYYNRGIIYEAMKKYDLAFSDFNKAIEINPRFASAYTYRSVIYGYRKEYDSAIEDLNKAIELNPQDARAYFHRGVNYQFKKEYELAIRDYGKAIELEPQEPEAYNNRGITYEAIGNKDLARADRRKYKELGGK